MSRKSFADLHDAEAFFHASCNEREVGAKALARLLSTQLVAQPRLRFLDFGGGDGRFLNEVLGLIKPVPSLASLDVVDVDTSAYDDYASRLQHVSEAPITVHETWPSGAKFDVICANHVLYYIENMKTWVTQAISHLAPGARAYITMGCPGLPLSRLWHDLFALVGRDLPYLGTQDLELELTQASLRFEVHSVPFCIRFSDSGHNRAMFLRFLLGSHYGAIGQSADGLLDRFVDRRGKVTIEHQDRIYSVSR